MIVNLENFIANLSFCLLFCTMLFYWIFTGWSKNAKINLLGNLGMIFSNLSILFLLLIRWKESGHFPLSNLYESLLFLSWSLTFLHLVLEKLNQTMESKIINFSFIGSITSPSALLTYAFATFSLPEEMQKSSALVPALQSNWLIMHVTIMILSYAALICGCLLSIAFLILTRGQEIHLSGNSFGDVLQYTSAAEKAFSETQLNSINTSARFKNQNSNDDLLSSSIETINFYDKSNVNCNINFLENDLIVQVKRNKTTKVINEKLFSSDHLARNLDNLSYRMLGIGFPLLTIGILSGAVWANEAWGSYWNWDPKETWALLTWLVFAIYLHTRLTKGWQGRKPAIIASFGFIIVWVCFIGVNLLGKGLHSYGWIRFFN